MSPCITSLRATQKCLGSEPGDLALTCLSLQAWDLEGVLRPLWERSGRLRLLNLQLEPQGRFYILYQLQLIDSGCMGCCALEDLEKESLVVELPYF